MLNPIRLYRFFHRSYGTFAQTQELNASSRYLNGHSDSITQHRLTIKEQKKLDTILRVDQAGELAANWIYMGQYAVLGKDPGSGPLIKVRYDDKTYRTRKLILPKEMWEQERKHLMVMNKLQVQYRVRPTGLWEIAKIAGFGLGAITALMSREAAMACTEAVETVIGEHYDELVRNYEEAFSSD